MSKLKIKTLVWLVALFAATFAAYGPALHGKFIWDDDDYVEKLEVLDEAGGLERIWFQDETTKSALGKQPTPQYYPVVFTTFWIENQLWGRSAEDTLGYHIVNVLLHTLSAVALWYVLARLEFRAAWFVAAVFALHPVHVESVAWITERKNVLSGLFYLLSFVSYVHFVGLVSVKQPQTPEPPEQARRKDKKGRAKQLHQVTASRPLPITALFYLLSILLFGAALLSKSVTASLPAAVLLVLYWKRGRIRFQDVLPLLPLFVMGFVAGSHTAEVERTNVFMHEVDLGVHGLEHILVAGRALWFYAGKLLFPATLCFMYPRWPLDLGDPLQWLYPVLAVGVLAAAWCARHRIGRGPLVALLFFGGTLIPALGFVDVYPMYYSYVADHFQYLASLGIILLVVGTSARVLSQSATPKIAALFGIVVVLALGAKTWSQSHDYRDLRTLWRATLERNPGSMMVAINLSNQVLREDGDDAEANHILVEALSNVAPGIHPTMHARALFNYGNNLGKLGDFHEAIVNYQRALEIDPKYINAYQGLGWACEHLGRTAEAIQHYESYLSGLHALGRDLPSTRAHVDQLKRERH